MRTALIATVVALALMLAGAIALSAWSGDRGRRPTFAPIDLHTERPQSPGTTLSPSESSTRPGPTDGASPIAPPPPPAGPDDPSDDDSTDDDPTEDDRTDDDGDDDDDGD